MKTYPKIGVQIPEILLPNKEIDLTRWAVIAVDQFTSEPEYWREVETLVGDAPSTFRLVLPEVLLGCETEHALIVNTQENMRSYLNRGLFQKHDGMILVERNAGGKTRYGLMLALDLERYDFNKGSKSLIRATEGTILDRLPPRIKIREGAPLELPHILVLIDDPECTVIEPLVGRKNELKKIYDFDLMLGSGHLTGYSVSNPADEFPVIESLHALANPRVFTEKYDVSSNQGVLLFAMGDGNHSLATAKAIWEKIKEKVGMDHPARYALVEIENVHDGGLEFEPIHRCLFGVKKDWLTAFKNYFGEKFSFISCDSDEEMVRQVNACTGSKQAIGVVCQDCYGVIFINNPPTNLPVGTLQQFLDSWQKNGGFEKIDYVHGSDITCRLGQQSGNLSFYVPPMEKSELFKTVILDGALPRKTFSMGSAREKRFYMESRRIT